MLNHEADQGMKGSPEHSLKGLGQQPQAGTARDGQSQLRQSLAWRTEGRLDLHSLGGHRARSHTGSQASVTGVRVTYRVLIMVHGLGQDGAERDGRQSPRLLPHGSDLQQGAEG